MFLYKIRKFIINMALKIYVVFHHNLENYYSGKILENIEFVSVNDGIKKDIKQENADIILESTLDGYLDMQKLRYNESSAMINLRRKIESSSEDFIGFLQYDNSISDSFLATTEKLLSEGKSVCISYFENKKMLESSLPYHVDMLKKTVDIYNEAYGTSHGYDKIAGPLFSTFFVKKETYLEMISFYDRCKYSIVDAIIEREGIRHIAGFLERFWGVFLNMNIGESLIEITDGFESHPEVKDVRNQLWRYQSGDCRVDFSNGKYILSCSVYLPDLARVDRIEKNIDESTLLGIKDGRISIESVFMD